MAPTVFPARTVCASRMWTLALALAGAGSMAHAQDLLFPTPPDLKPVKTDELRTLAATVQPGCASFDAFGWTSKRPAEDLTKLLASMQAQPGFRNVTETPAFAGKPADASRRLYTGRARSDDAPAMFLWVAGKSQVVLQTCKGTPPVKKNGDFDRCADGTGALAGTLTACPPTSSM